MQRFKCSLNIPRNKRCRGTVFLLLFIAAFTGDAEIALAKPLTDGAQTATETPEESNHWFLMQSLVDTEFGQTLDRQRIQISGWTEASFTASSASTEQLPMGFNYKANEALLQQHWLRVERRVDADSGNPSWGFLSDTLLPGSDYRFTLARGLFDRQSGTHGIDPVQFYAQTYFPQLGEGLEIKLGRFFGQYGVESIAGTETPFSSRAYNFIYNPFTHTGLLTTLKLGDTWTIQNGLVTGSDVFIHKASTPTYIGSAKWAPTEGRDTLMLAIILGSGRYDRTEAFDNPQVFDLVYTRQISKDLTYTLNILYGYQNKVPDIGTATWFGIVNYLTHAFSANLDITSRLEFFNDIDGNRTGFSGLYTAITGGLDYRPRRDIIIRPEIRYDENNKSRPFEDQRRLLTAALDVILRW